MKTKNMMMTIGSKHQEKAAGLYRWLEGVSSLAMPLGYILAGGPTTNFLFVVYWVHFIASFFYHTFPSKTTYRLDVSLIHYLILERMYLLYHNIGLYLAIVLSLFLEDDMHHVALIIRLCIVIGYGVWRKTYSLFMLSLWGMTGFLYMLSCQFWRQNDPVMTTFTCVWYHLSLGILSFVEVDLYDDQETSTSRMDGFVRCCCLFLFVSWVMTRMTKNPKRLRSVLTLLTALVLSPLSIQQIYYQVHHSRTEYFHDNEPTQTLMLSFYLAYLVVDVSLGWIYYLKYFNFLEGWVHHIGTAVFVLYYQMVLPENKNMVCMNLIIEISTIVLCSSRVLYDVPWIQTIRHKCLYPLFFMTRILAPVGILLYFYPLYDPFAYVVFVAFTSLNLWWLFQMMCLVPKK